MSSQESKCKMESKGKLWDHKTIKFLKCPPYHACGPCEVSCNPVVQVREPWAPFTELPLSCNRSSVYNESRLFQTPVAGQRLKGTKKGRSSGTNPNICVQREMRMDCQRHGMNQGLWTKCGKSVSSSGGRGGRGGAGPQLKRRSPEALKKVLLNAGQKVDVKKKPKKHDHTKDMQFCAAESTL